MGRPAVLKAMKESKDEDVLQLHFDGFLQLMRLSEQSALDERVHKEQETVKKLGLQRSEVNAFREIFVRADSEVRGSLGIESYFTMLLQQFDLDNRQVNISKSLFGRLISERRGLQESKEADFSDFLVLMKQLETCLAESKSEILDASV